jgi:hypothetical protein
MRINDQDILAIQNITNDLEKNDPMEKKGFLNLTDDLKSPVKYSSDRHNAGTDQFPKSSSSWEDFLPNTFVAPADKTRVVIIPYQLPNNE